MPKTERPLVKLVDALLGCYLEDKDFMAALEDLRRSPNVTMDTCRKVAEEAGLRSDWAEPVIWATVKSRANANGIRVFQTGILTETHAPPEPDPDGDESDYVAQARQQWKWENEATGRALTDGEAENTGRDACRLYRRLRNGWSWREIAEDEGQDYAPESIKKAVERMAANVGIMLR
jgi:hypothetical protein